MAVQHIYISLGFHITNIRLDDKLPRHLRSSALKIAAYIKGIMSVCATPIGS